MAFVPILLVARHTPPRQAFGYGFLSGLAFWLIALSWLLMLRKTGGPDWPLPAAALIVGMGWALLAGYCALYTAAFLAVAAWLLQAGAPASDRDPAGRSTETNGRSAWSEMGRSMALVILVPLVWTGFEHLRSVALTGFPWNALGISQYRNTRLIQIADVGGVYAVSAAIMLMNVALTLTVEHLQKACFRRARRRLLVELLAAGLVFAGLLSYGRRVEQREQVRADELDILVGGVQPNVPQLKKFPAEFAQSIYDTLRKRTELAARGRPDLIVWPETAVPGLVPQCTGTVEFVSGLARQGSWLLAGAMEDAGRWGGDSRVPQYHNSSFLFDRHGRIRDRYRKRHLVPFGEYLPLDDRIRFLAELAPLGFSCVPGATSTVFRLELARNAGAPADARFGVMICFEDVFAYLARDLVRAGARLLVNQTNDAWFDGTSAAVQHMSHCVFRCVENRVPAVRVGNTGVTCGIDRLGRVDSETQAAINGGTIHLQSYRSLLVRLRPSGDCRSFYGRHGDAFFAIPSAVLALALLVAIAMFAPAGRAHHGPKGPSSRQRGLRPSASHRTGL
ncbi:MAG: apolipoprotein N-acyltransferase, partial [Verrucomicrobiota bacterium]|nr:apolipoprotein N-acyltransferase [Verrucomicrobiota bacterium]